jgi:DNA-directed RNA polymerase specialized sigma24 family protein
MASQSHSEGQPTTKLTSAARLLYDECCSDDRHVRNAAYQQVGEYLLRMADARLRTRPYLKHLAQEATQQALMTIWQKLQEGRGPQEPQWFLSWCGSIVIHKLLDELRKLGRPAAELLADEDEEGATLLMIPDSTAIAPEHHMIESESNRELMELIQDHPALRPDYKTVLLNGYFLDQDDSELAHNLGLATASIRVLRFRGLQQLRSDGEFMAKLEQLAFPLQQLGQPRDDETTKVRPNRRQRKVKSRTTQLP